MKKLTIGLMVLSVLATFSIVGFGDTEQSHDVDIEIPEIVALGLSGSTISLTPSEPAVAGNLPADVEDKGTINLDYIVISANGYKITAKLDTDITSKAFELYVNTQNTDIPANYEFASGDAGTGPTNGVELTGTGTAPDLITGITSPVATGTDGATDGATLNYTLHFTNVPEKMTTKTYEVTYTLTTS